MSDEKANPASDIRGDSEENFEISDEDLDSASGGVIDGGCTPNPIDVPGVDDWIDGGMDDDLII